MAWAGGSQFREELVLAKSEFFKTWGEVRDDEPCFDAFMDAFVDWYLCDRAMAASGATPAQLFVREQSGTPLTPEEQVWFGAFANTRLGLFRLESFPEGAVVISDLQRKEKLTVVERRKMAGVEKGDLFHGRVIPLPDGLYFTGALLFHPKEMRKGVLKIAHHARRAGPKAFEVACAGLMHRRLKVDRYKRVPPSQLYSDLIPKGLVPFW